MYSLGSYAHPYPPGNNTHPCPPMNNNIEPMPTQNPYGHGWIWAWAWVWAPDRGCHTSFFVFSENGEWGRGTLSWNGGGPILGDWRMKNGETSCAKGFTAKPLFFILHSPRATKGYVSHLSPWRSYPIGSSFSSFSIFHSPILRGGVTTPSV
jgi:hypothetical protein